MIGAKWYAVYYVNGSIKNKGMRGWKPVEKQEDTPIKIWGDKKALARIKS